MEKNPRFCMVLADCCNNFGYNVSPKFVLMNAAGSSNIEEPQSDNMKKLFLEQKGSLTISASRAGEYSFVNIDPRSPYAGVFFDAFRQNLTAYTSEASSQCNWSTLLKRVYDHVSGIDIPFNGRLWKQHPVYRIETEKKSRPKTDDNVVDIPDSKIKSQLEWIGDDRNDPPHQRVQICAGHLFRFQCSGQSGRPRPADRHSDHPCIQLPLALVYIEAFAQDYDFPGGERCIRQNHAPCSSRNLCPKKPITPSL